MTLSNPQQRVFDAIGFLIAKEGISPSVREIGDRAGLSSTSTVHKHLWALRRLGLVEWRPEVPRSLKLVGFDPHEGVRALCTAARLFAAEVRAFDSSLPHSGPSDDETYQDLLSAVAAVEASLPPST